MIIRDIEAVEPDSLEFAVKVRLDMDWRIISMFVAEPHGKGPRVLRTLLRKGDDVHCFLTDLTEPRYPSVGAAIPSAVVYERTIAEMSGVEPVDHPYLVPNMYWRKGNGYPLQKEDYSIEGETRIPIPSNEVTGSSIFEIPVGPVHAGVIEPGHFRFSVAGEPILNLRVHLGYVHRGVEKMMESGPADSHMRLVERISGDTAVAHSLAYAHLLEGDAEVPSRAGYIRVILAELERIYNHLDAVTGLCVDTAFSVAAAYGMEARERVLRINKDLFGSRVLMGNIVPGGVRRDISPQGLEKLELAMLYTEFATSKIEKIIKSTPSEIDRLETTGILSRELAEELGTVGPVARASGLTSDVRAEMPYDAYRVLNFNVATSNKGDVLARGMVRIKSIKESVSLILQAIDDMTEGPLRADFEPAEGLACGIVEAPRGELVHTAEISDGKIWRYNVRDPSFVNWQALEYAVLGNIVPDFPVINKSFGLSYSGHDL